MREKITASRATPTDGACGDVTSGEGRFALPTGVVLEADVAYGDDAAQRLDVYRPAVVTDAPLILFVHGGGWRRGDKALPQMVRNKVAHWVPRGFVFLSINHRMLPAANPLEQCEDLGHALAFTQRNAGRWGGDGSRVVVVGHSSGAHLAALLTVDDDLATRQGVLPWLATIALDTAALDVEAIMLRQHLPLYDVAFGANPGLWRAASPAHQLRTRPAAPMLLVSSSLRHDSVAQSQTFAARAVDAGGRATLLPVPLSHRQINIQLGVPGAYTDAVDRFLQSVGIG